MPTYTSEFSDIVSDEFIKAWDGDVLPYSIDVEGDFASPPILLASRYMGMVQKGKVDHDFEDLIVHYCVKGKKITISLDGVSVGSFVSNDIADSWDTFPVFGQHPIAFGVLKNAATFSIVKKFMPPLRAGAQMAAGEKQEWK